MLHRLWLPGPSVEHNPNTRAAGTIASSPLLCPLPRLFFPHTNPNFFSHGSRGSHRIALWMGNLTEAGRMGVWGGQITPSALSALSAPITKTHTDPTKFNKNNLW